LNADFDQKCPGQYSSPPPEDEPGAVAQGIDTKAGRGLLRGVTALPMLAFDLGCLMGTLSRPDVREAVEGAGLDLEATYDALRPLIALVYQKARR
jgi:hypothetical protein